MPRGKPNAGFRKTEAWSRKTGLPKIDYNTPGNPEIVCVPYAAPAPTQAPLIGNGFEAVPLPQYDDSHKSNEDILKRINRGFDVLSYMVEEAITGDARAIVVSGPPGVGKSHNVITRLREWDPNMINHTVIKGTVRGTGLYKTLYEYNEPGQVIVFDDADSIFQDEQCLNFLKACCDTSDNRVVSYLAENSLYSDKKEEAVPKTFDFKGTIIFISNHDFAGLIARGSRLSPHLDALMSRSHFIDLEMKTTRAKVLRIMDIIDKGMLIDMGLKQDQVDDVKEFLYKYKDSLRELSLRTAIKVGQVRRRNSTSWEDVCSVTCCRND